MEFTSSKLNIGLGVLAVIVLQSCCSDLNPGKIEIELELDEGETHVLTGFVSDSLDTLRILERDFFAVPMENLAFQPESIEDVIDDLKPSVADMINLIPISVSYPVISKGSEKMSEIVDPIDGFMRRVPCFNPGTCQEETFTECLKHFIAENGYSNIFSDKMVDENPMSVFCTLLLYKREVFTEMKFIKIRHNTWYSIQDCEHFVKENTPHPIKYSWFAYKAMKDGINNQKELANKRSEDQKRKRKTTEKIIDEASDALQMIEIVKFYINAFIYTVEANRYRLIEWGVNPEYYKRIRIALLRKRLQEVYCAQAKYLQIEVVDRL